MVVSEQTIGQAVTTLRSFGAKRVLLFGSYLQAPENARDIDLAAEGIPLDVLWKADGALSDVLNVPYDLVIREESPEFYELIRKQAAVLYEETSPERADPVGVVAAQARG